MNQYPDSNGIRMDLVDGEIRYFPGFFSTEESDKLYLTLLEHTPWQQDDIKLFGKTYKQPRLTALYGSNGLSYSYSNITMHPHPFSQDLLKVKMRIEKVLDVSFTTCLLNLYRDGSDSNGWHSDNEKELGINPIIASVSFGAERIFKLKHKERKDLKKSISLEHGSLLIMQGKTQHHWLHQVPKTKKPIGKRINLTFRIIE